MSAAGVFAALLHARLCLGQHDGHALLGVSEATGHRWAAVGELDAMGCVRLGDAGGADVGRGYVELTRCTSAPCGDATKESAAPSS